MSGALLNGAPLRSVASAGPARPLLNGELAYLATPYSKYPAGPERAFVDAVRLAAALARAGVRIYSPIVHSHPLASYGGLDPLDHAFWLPFNEVQLNAAGVLIVAQMAGWQESAGIAHEVAFFERAGKPVFDLQPASLLMTRRKGAAEAGA
jgi:hypothetical protein